MNNLPNNEQRVYDILKENYPNWINKGELRNRYYPDYRESFDTYMGKLLKYLMDKGLVESKPCIKDGKKQHYYSYRLIKAPLREGKEIDSTMSKIDRMNKVTDTNKQEIIKECKKVLTEYPEGYYINKEKIKKQIKRLEGEG